MGISIKYKLLIPAVLLLVVGMSTVSVVSHIKAKQALSKAIVNEIDNVARTTVNSMSTWLHERMIDVGNLSQQGVYKKALINSFLGLTARTFANEQLARIKRDYEDYTNIMLADNAGDIVAASDQKDIGRGNVSDRVYFQKAQAGELFITRHALNSKKNGKLIVVISAPVREKKAVTGVIFAVFEVDSLVKQFTGSIRVGEHGFAYIVMDKGYIVCNDSCAALTGKNINDFDFGPQIIGKSSGVVNYTLEGTRMTASYKKVDKVNWILVVSAVNDEIMQPVQALGRINTGVTIAVALVVGIVMVLITLTISRPIREVVDGLKQMGQGDLSFRLSVENHDEIGQIGRELNRMARNLEMSDRKIKEQNMQLTRARDDLELRVEQRTYALRQAEKKYRGIFENAVEGIFQGTPEGYILNANPSFAKILGYDSVADMLAGSKPLLFPVSRSAGRQMMVLLENEGKIVAHEAQIRRRDGQEFWGSVSASRVYNEETRQTYYEGFVVDLSERREKEKAVREYKAAQAANRAKSEFIANMSHEIRTPLNTLLGFSELLAADLNDPKQESYIDAMRLAGNSLLTLINDILDLSKIEAGKMTFKNEPVNLKILFSEIRYIFADKLDQKEIELTVNHPEELPDTVLVDETRLRQIFLNLVGNAVKFTDSGSITLSLITEPGALPETVDLMIKVKDTGPGIDPEYQEVIFESFRQVDGQINRKHGGTGLGLAICKRLTEAMGGTISLESSPGKGSEFTFALKNVACVDATAGDIERSSTKRKLNQLVFERKTILIVDDIESNRTMLKEILLRYKQNVIEAMDGRQAIEMTKSNPPDLIIMDIRMPLLDGNEATKILKSDPLTQNIPIIAFTGDVVSKTKDGILKKGYDGYLTKPVKIEELNHELSKYIPSQAGEAPKKAEPIDWAAFSIDDVKNSKVLLSELKNNVLPTANFYKNNIVINQIKEFSDTLAVLSSTHQVRPLQLFSRQLKEAVRIFDITQIERKMQALPGLLEELILKL